MPQKAKWARVIGTFPNVKGWGKSGDEDGGYVVPIKDSVRSANGLEIGNRVTVQLEVRAARPGGGT